MKKLLIATTALTMTAGAAAAQSTVTVGGDARMGFAYDSALLANKTTFQHRVRLVFQASVETDSGVTFGVWSRANIQHSNTALPGANQNNWDGSRIWARAGGLTVTAGYADGAVLSRVGIYQGGLGFTNTIARPGIHLGRFSEERQGENTVRADYTVDAFTASVSVGYSTAGVINGPAVDRPELAVSYRAAGFNVGAGFKQGGHYALSATYGQDAWSVGALAVRVNGVGTNYRLHGTYAFGATTVGATFSKLTTAKHFGIGANYNLGGGASVRGAVARVKPTVGAASTQAQLGVTFSF